MLKSTVLESSLPRPTHLIHSYSHPAHMCVTCLHLLTCQVQVILLFANANFSQVNLVLPYRPLSRNYDAKLAQIPRRFCQWTWVYLLSEPRNAWLIYNLRSQMYQNNTCITFLVSYKNQFTLLSIEVSIIG